jgi:succinyl-diaminopimelate desuccinylase
MARNPIPGLVAALNELAALRLDEGTDWFQPSNLEITTVDVGNPATNVIPAMAKARLNIRFSDLHRGEALVAQVREILTRHAPEATLTAKISGEAFLTPPGALSDMVSAAVRRVTGVTPELSTGGGTSDARFLSSICPVVEFGLVNATMHKLDEAVAIPDLLALADIYEDVIRTALV